MTKTYHDKRFPNETDDYRSARNALLEQEVALRKQVAAVAAARRQLPLGGEVKEDYVFQKVEDGVAIRLSELFAAGKDTLALYSFMFAPGAEKPCPSCNSITESFEGAARHIRQRINFAIVTRAPVEQMQAWVAQKGWKDLLILSSYENTYNSDYFAEMDIDSQMPILNLFVKRDSGIFHFYASELLYTGFEQGDPRHMDMMWPLWNLFDTTPEGRGDDWYPQHSYE